MIGFGPATVPSFHCLTSVTRVSRDSREYLPLAIQLFFSSKHKSYDQFLTLQLHRSLNTQYKESLNHLPFTS